MKIIARPAVALALAIGLSAGVAAQDPLSDVKQLYDSASYSEALSALNKVPSTSSLEEVEKYRALCFLALDQPKSAEQALEHLTMARPLFTLDGADMSPRLVALFQNVRRRTLPAAAKQLYQEARAGFDNGNLAEASRQFKDVVSLADAAPQDQAALMADLKMLAAGFLRLSETPAPKPDAPSAPAPADAQVLPAANRVFNQSSAGIQPPVVIARTIPNWARPVALQKLSFKGALELDVSEEGSVTAATMVESLHPTYDDVLVSAAKKWRFKPATEAGRPVKYRLLYEMVVEPTQ